MVVLGLLLRTEPTLENPEVTALKQHVARIDAKIASVATLVKSGDPIAQHEVQEMQVARSSLVVAIRLSKNPSEQVRILKGTV